MLYIFVLKEFCQPALIFIQSESNSLQISSDDSRSHFQLLKGELKMLPVDTKVADKTHSKTLKSVNLYQV